MSPKRDCDSEGGGPSNYQGRFVILHRSKYFHVETYFNSIPLLQTKGTGATSSTGRTRRRGGPPRQNANAVCAATMPQLRADIAERRLEGREVHQQQQQHSPGGKNESSHRMLRPRRQRQRRRPLRCVRREQAHSRTAVLGIINISKTNTIAPFLSFDGAVAVVVSVKKLNRLPMHSISKYQNIRNMPGIHKDFSQKKVRTALFREKRDTLKSSTIHTPGARRFASLTSLGLKRPGAPGFVYDCV